MNDKAIGEIISALRAQRRDNAQYEAKTCAQELSKDVWETVSAFANTDELIQTVLGNIRTVTDTYGEQGASIA